jgi:hypothetical protein
MELTMEMEAGRAGVFCRRPTTSKMQLNAHSHGQSLFKGWLRDELSYPIDRVYDILFATPPTSVHQYTSRFPDSIVSGDMMAEPTGVLISWKMFVKSVGR